MITVGVARADHEQGWIEQLRSAIPGATVAYLDQLDRTAVDYVVGWRFAPGALDGLPRVSGVLLTGAGYDHLTLDALPPVPVVRLIDPAMADDIAAYCVSWIIHFTRDFDRFRQHQARREWASGLPDRFPRDVTVGVLGAGAIGAVVLDRCRSWGFPVVGWSRSAHDRSLLELFETSDVVVSVLPSTPDTRHLISTAQLEALGDGVLINVGRGATVDHDALLIALDGRLRAAVLDVFDTEPLAPDSPLWRHPKLIVTPHVAGRTDPVTASSVIAASIGELAAGRPPRGVIAALTTRRVEGDGSNM